MEAEENSGVVVNYVCADCGTMISLQNTSTIKCRVCGSRILYKKRCRKYKLKKHICSYPFHKPVDWKKLGLDDYPKVITNPIDLQTMTKRVQNNYYPDDSIIEFTNDLATIWNNCKTYNDINTEIYQMATTMEAEANKLIDRSLSSDAQLIDAIHANKSKTGDEIPTTQVPAKRGRGRPPLKRIEKEIKAVNINEGRKKLLIKFANRLASLSENVAHMQNIK